PAEIRSLLRLAEDENVIYDGVFNEMVRQVTVHMIERGDLLAEIRKRYANMFAQIPKVVKNLYGELCAERVMNRRLAGELLRTRDSVRQLGERLVAIQRAEAIVSAQGTDARDQLLEVLARTEHVDETLAEYHALYRMQRKRLEMQIRHMDQERKVWVDAATHLALRIGSEHGLPDVAVLQKYEYGRLRAVNHMVSLLAGFDRSEVQKIESRADAWVKDMIDRAKDIEREDNKCVAILQKTLREVRSLQKMLEIDDTSDGAAMDRARNMLLFETRSSVDMIKKWAEATNQVSTRYTSDRDEHILEQLTNAQRGLSVWVGLAVAVLQRTEKSTARKEYLELQTRLTLLQEELEGWINKLRTKVSGDDGIASAVIALQNQIEDRYAVFAGVRDRERAISAVERFMLRESLGSWQEQLGILIVMMSSSSGSEEKRLPLNVENWLTKLMDQLNNDTELRNDGLKHQAHNSLVRWMVQLLIKTGRQAPDKSWDQELTQLELEINELNKMLIKDAGDMEVLSDDRKDLRLVANSYSNAWFVHCLSSQLAQLSQRDSIQFTGCEQPAGSSNRKSAQAWYKFNNAEAPCSAHMTPDRRPLLLLASRLTLQILAARQCSTLSLKATLTRLHMQAPWANSLAWLCQKVWWTCWALANWMCSRVQRQGSRRDGIHCLDPEDWRGGRRRMEMKARAD
ncbi:hypothetical protein BCR44DRAFT_1390896, partial [Catenaria anguillulae PL171]